MSYKIAWCWGRLRLILLDIIKPVSLWIEAENTSATQGLLTEVCGRCLPERIPDTPPVHDSWRFILSPNKPRSFPPNCAKLQGFSSSPAATDGVVPNAATAKLVHSETLAVAETLALKSFQFLANGQKCALYVDGGERFLA